jgi:Uma2 family endonuclease
VGTLRDPEFLGLSFPGKIVEAMDFLLEAHAVATISTVMTEEQILALPDVEGIERELIRGELRERPTMTTRGFAHSAVLSRIVYRLSDWLVRQPTSRGVVVSGEARIRLRTDAPTFVGVDVAYFDAPSRPSNPRKAKFVDGPPVLAVEILSPSDQREDIADKVSGYPQAGASLVWVVDTLFSTVTVHRPDARPQLFDTDQELAAEPFLPGFLVAVAELFEDLER